MNQSAIQMAQGGREKKDGGGRAPSTDWIFGAGYVTSLGVLVKHSKQRGKCLKGSLCAAGQHDHNTANTCYYAASANPHTLICSIKYSMLIYKTIKIKFQYV